MLHRLILASLAVAAAITTTHVHAWGNVGHQLTGDLAMALLSPATRTRVSQLIRDEDGDLGKASTWADRVKFTKGFGFTRTLHYVDAKDHPPHDCNFDQERDCPNGKCITGAIGNYTTRLSCRYDAKERGIAVKFLMHFLGDLTQPLHTCERARGGNEVKVMFDGETTYKPPSKRGKKPPPKGGKKPPPKGNDDDDDDDDGSEGASDLDGSNLLNLHGVWDYNILEKRIREGHGNSVEQMRDHLLEMARNAVDSAEGQEWTACMRARRSTPLECAISWTKDSNAINCDTVWKLYDANPSQDLGGKYYKAAWPVIEKQIVKAGVRAAALFEANVKQCQGDDSGDDNDPEA